LGKKLAVALGLGAGYGLLAFEAVSPVAVALLLWAIVVLVWIWRLPPASPILGVSAAGFLAGFAVVWGGVLGRQFLTCNPPACQAAGPFTDVLYGLAFTVPLILIAALEISVRCLLLKR